MSEVGSLGRSADILLVEDNPDDVNLNRLAFQQVDIAHQLTFRDGQEAMAFLRREGKFASAPRPDLILFDPETCRLRTVKWFSRRSSKMRVYRRIPVIILTTSDSATDRILAYRHNANAYLVKPMDIDELYEMVQSIAHFWLKQLACGYP